MVEKKRSTHRFCVIGDTHTFIHTHCVCPSFKYITNMCAVFAVFACPFLLHSRQREKLRCWSDVGCSPMPVVRAACDSSRVLSRQYVRNQRWTAECTELGSVEVAVDGAAGRWRFQESPRADHRLFITHVHTFLTIVVFSQREHFYLMHPGSFVSTAKEIKACLLNRFKLFQYLHNWKETTGVK